MKTGLLEKGFLVMHHFNKITAFINFENFTIVIQSNNEPWVYPPVNIPAFLDIWAPTGGFIFNGGLKLKIF
jgi:iron complex outermembrane receptor protein